MMSISPAVRSLLGRGSPIAVACAIAFSSPAMAQQEAPASPPPTPQDGAAAEATPDIVVQGRFVNTGASSATKLDIALRDTPFSVDAYNGNFLKAIETTNVADLYKYMTGIQRAGNTGYDITFRGFKASGSDRNAILTDGLPGLSVRFGSPPTIGVDHVELVKGPTSVLYGQAQPGGFINLITKKPKMTPFFEAELKGLLGVGPLDRQSGGLFSLDATGPIVGSDRLAARFVGEGGYTRDFRDFSYTKPIYAAPSLLWHMDDRTTITLQGEYRWVKAHYDTYLVAPNRDVSRIAAITTTYQEPSDTQMERGAIGNIFVTHRFSSGVALNVGYRYVDHYDATTGFDVVGFRDPANTILTRRARGQQNWRTYSFVDANLTAKFDTAGIGHNVILGVNAGRETSSFNRTQFYNCTGAACNALDISLYNPVHGIYPAPETFPLYNTGQASNQNWRFTGQNSLGFYFSDLISFTEMFKALVGVRYADERQNISDLRITSFVPVAKHDTKWLPTAGLLFEPSHHVTFYASYATSFVPVPASNFDINGNNPFKPTTATSIEGGVKLDLFDHRLTVNGAYFDIKKKNTINTFACSLGTCSEQVGGERSRGFEVELNATPMPHWQITAGYAHTYARISASDVPVQLGARLTNAPDNAVNLWSRYDFSGSLHDLGIGAGFSFIGTRAGMLPTVANDTRPDGGTLPLPAYATVDLGVYYKAGPVDLTMKVSNLFDKRYIESAGLTGDQQLVPGTPRLLTLTARVRI